MIATSFPELPRADGKARRAVRVSGLVIAIDGPAASGKGTLARRLAAHFGLPHLDTGLLYRATACALLDEGLPLDDVEAATAAARGLSLDRFRRRAAAHPRHGRGGLDRRGAAAGARRADRLAAPLRRARRGRRARRARHRHGGLPQAPREDFRHRDARKRGRSAARWSSPSAARRSITPTILADIKKRDERDSDRAAAPLKPADDAVMLDTTDLDIEAAFRGARHRGKGAGRAEDRRSAI